MEKSKQFVDFLKKLEAAALAHLRRSLAFEVGTDVRVFPYVERFVQSLKEPSERKRQAHYLVAGLFALRHREGDFAVLESAAGESEGGAPVETKRPNLGGSIGRIRDRENERPPSLEKRFIHLLDASFDELAQPLRQMVSLLKAHNLEVDWEALLNDLLDWPRADRRVQRRWAREFYGATDESQDQSKTEQGTEKGR